MRPDEYELLVAEHFERNGYKTTVSSFTNDYGVDVFATRGAEKIAIQAKMYGGTSRPINRQMVMELHGAKDYFDCTAAVIATNGRIIDNAFDVARKLNIQILEIRAVKTTINNANQGEKNRFEFIWEKYVMALEGKTITRPDGSLNVVEKVDWSGLCRVTSNGKTQFIDIEIFKKTINHLLVYGEITRSYINVEYKNRASSGIVLILGNTEIFQITEKPKGLKMKSRAKEDKHLY